MTHLLTTVDREKRFTAFQRAIAVAVLCNQDLKVAKLTRERDNWLIDLQSWDDQQLLERHHSSSRETTKLEAVEVKHEYRRTGKSISRLFPDMGTKRRRGEQYDADGLRLPKVSTDIRVTQKEPSLLERAKSFFSSKASASAHAETMERRQAAILARRDENGETRKMRRIRLRKAKQAQAA